MAASEHFRFAMKRSSLSLIAFVLLTGFTLTVQAQAGRVRNETRSATDNGPFSESLNKAPEPQLTKQGQEQLGLGSRIEWPRFVNGEQIYRPKELDSRAVVTKKPAAVFAQEARKRSVEGTVVLRAVFSSTAEVRDITVIVGLPYGLTENAIKAAHKMKFRPALKDGKPVSTWAQLEYTFSLY
jgi:TonB family protein